VSVGRAPIPRKPDTNLVGDQLGHRGGDADGTRSKLPRLALSKAEAAEALGVSIDFLEEHVMHELRIVRRGRRRLIPTVELVRWLESNAHRTLGAA
jgi:excisionase family DNA binding protein